MELSPLSVILLLIPLIPVAHVQDGRPVLSVYPQNWLTEGDSVTLSCEVTDSSADWSFSWYIKVPKNDNNNDMIEYQRFSNSTRGSKGSYTLSAAIKYTGVYVCRGTEGKKTSFTDYSNQQPLWITGKSSPVSLIINPYRTQHFTNSVLSLSCEDQRGKAGSPVRRYTNTNTNSDNRPNCLWGLDRRSECEISSASTSDSGVYWCEPDFEENSNPVNITVHDGDVILDSPVHPVTEGHRLTLRCLYRNTNSPIQQADFYKDGSVLQNQTAGEMIIQTVSKSDEGFYHCKHSERGESPKSWISVRSKEFYVGNRSKSRHGTVGLAVGLTLSISLFYNCFTDNYHSLGI